MTTCQHDRGSCALCRPIGADGPWRNPHLDALLAEIDAGRLPAVPESLREAVERAVAHRDVTPHNFDAALAFLMDGPE